jgi:hypothetical protein
MLNFLWNACAVFGVLSLLSLLVLVIIGCAIGSQFKTQNRCHRKNK